MLYVSECSRCPIGGLLVGKKYLEYGSYFFRLPFADFTGAHSWSWVGRALAHDLVLFLLPAAVACTEMDSSDMPTLAQEACSAINKIADDHKEMSKEQNEQFLFSVETFISQYQNL